MDKTAKQFTDIIIRYTILIFSAFPNLFLFLFYIHPSNNLSYLLSTKLFFESSLMGNIILVNKIPVEIISACIAGSAYYLLFILNLSIPNIKIKKE